MKKFLAITIIFIGIGAHNAFAATAPGGTASGTSAPTTQAGQNRQLRSALLQLRSKQTSTKTKIKRNIATATRDAAKVKRQRKAVKAKRAKIKGAAANAKP